jgi:hypothetical protein
MNVPVDLIAKISRKRTRNWGLTQSDLVLPVQKGLASARRTVELTVVTGAHAVGLKGANTCHETNQTVRLTGTLPLLLNMKFTFDEVDILTILSCGDGFQQFLVTETGTDIQERLCVPYLHQGRQLQALLPPNLQYSYLQIG